MMSQQKPNHDQGAMEAALTPGDHDDSVEEVVRSEEDPVCNLWQLRPHGRYCLPVSFQIAEALTQDDKFDHDSLHPPCPREPHQEDFSEPNNYFRTFENYPGWVHDAGFGGPHQASTRTFTPRAQTTTRPATQRGEPMAIGNPRIWVYGLALYFIVGMLGLWILALLLCALVGLVIWVRLSHRR